MAIPGARLLAVQGFLLAQLPPGALAKRRAPVLQQLDMRLWLLHKLLEAS